MSTSACEFSKIIEKPKGKSILLGFQGVEVGPENRPKIDPKRRCQRERVLASILGGFVTVLGSKLSPKMDPNLEKIQLGGCLGGQVEPQNDSAVVLGAKLSPQTGSRGPSWAARPAKDAPKGGLTIPQIWATAGARILTAKRADLGCEAR